MHTLEQLRAGKLHGIRRLDLHANLTAFPDEIFSLADSLEILDLSGNQLDSLPDDLPRLHKLRVLFCSNNQFTVLPEVLARCPQLSMVGFKSNRIEHIPDSALPAQLRWLILTDNRLRALPAAIGQCTQLQKLMLAGNQLRALPPELAMCTRLELLRIAANELNELPAWLLRLPRLAWLAYAGNPFNAPDEHAVLQHTHIPTISWPQLQLQCKLGEGASGVIHRATWQHDSGLQGVAVKLFKGTVTSDGLPRSEMVACLSAGTHPSLIGTLGQLSELPDNAAGLVMELIDPAFHSLAGPPSLESCTRDCYSPDRWFSPDAALRIAHGIASAAAHLHRRGILHGDLYAHNILHDEMGHALLGDFGAASFFSMKQPDLALALQHIETRAFACLLEELLARCTMPDPTGNHLAELQARCSVADPAARPTLGEVAQSLQQLQSDLSL